MQHNTRYFLGTTTPDGFFNSIDDMKHKGEINRLFIIKGGPGTGKSSLMKRLASYYESKGEQVEIFYCSSDPQSLDGIYNPARKVAFVDGTAPHEISPRYPGAFEDVIELSAGFNTKQLQNHREEIKRLCDICDGLHFQAKQYLTAAKTVKAAVKDRASRYLSNRLGKNAFALKTPPASTRILSAVSNKRCIFFADAIESQTNTVAICDPYGAAGISVINRFITTAAGDVTMGLCPLTLTPEHLIMPQMDTAITVKNSYHNAKSGITFEKNMLYKNMPKDEEAQLDRSVNLVQKLVKTACEYKQKAFEIHGQIERYYINAMDFSAVDSAFEKYKDRI